MVDSIGQRAFYSAKQFLDDNGLLAVDMSTSAPLYSLSAKGKKVAAHLAEVEKSDPNRANLFAAY